MKPGNKQEKIKAKEKLREEKIIRDSELKFFEVSAKNRDQRENAHERNSLKIRKHSSEIEEEHPQDFSGKQGNQKDKKTISSKLIQVQNLTQRYKKFQPLATHPQEDEFETPELLEKLRKTAIEEVRDRPKYTLGNYDTYYNYRYEKRWQDPRLRLFKKDYFLNKECLDIGCNEGSLTILIAIKFFPKKIVGMDIDYKLINKAINNLRYFEKQQALCKTPPAILNKEKEKAPELQQKVQENIDDEKVKQLMEKLKNLPKSFVVNMGIPTNWGHNDIEKNKLLAATTTKFIQEEEKKENEMAMEVEKPKEEKKTLQIENRFPDNIHFQVENIVKDMNVNEKYDTILCLSTTKWIHLNWGDCGVRRLFKKVYDSLRPGGHFILEPQDWKSYKKRKYLSKDFKFTYLNIQLRPHNFENYLIQRLGFKLVTKLVPDSENVKTEGFKRPIYIFQKVNSLNETEMNTE